MGSGEEAKKKLVEMRRMVRVDEAKAKGHGFTAEDFRRAEKRMKAGIEAGKITREEAERRLAEMRKRMHSQDKSQRPGRGAELRKKYQAAEKEIRAAVEAGKISREEAREKLMEVGKTLRGVPGKGGG